MKKPKILNHEILFDGFYRLEKDTLEGKNGDKHEYTHLTLTFDAAVILGETSSGKFIINREYRHPISAYILGLPGGGLNKEEDPKIGALREFSEETGYWSDELIPLGITHQMPALCGQKVYFFWAKNAYLKSKQDLDPLEFIQTELKTEQELMDEVKAGTVLDGHLLTAFNLRNWMLKDTQIVIQK